jgi:hypothetical protein
MEGSIKSSHREMSQVRLKIANTFLHDLAIQFVETRLQDQCIRQRLQPDKENLVKKGTFFLLENESRAEPGFLLFLPGQPALFFNMRSKTVPVFTLRMRTDITLGDGGGTLLVATLDKIQHTLRLEDVWIWKGEMLQSQKTFTQRRVFLKEFVERSWTPDARLMGGITTTVANPKPLSSLADVAGCFSVDLIPELAGKRRFYFQLESSGDPNIARPQALVQLKPDVQVKPQVQPHVQVKPQVQVQVKPQVQPQVQIKEKKISAFAVPLLLLPDVYDLYLEDETPLCRAAVQQISLSQKLNAAIAKKITKIPVIAEWKAEFGRYEIISVSV